MQIYFKDVKSKTKNFPNSHSNSKTFYLLPSDSFELIYNYLPRHNRLIDFSRLYSTIIAKENFTGRFPLLNPGFISLDIPLYSNKNKLIGSFIIPLLRSGKLLRSIETAYIEDLYEFTSLLNAFLYKIYILEKLDTKAGSADE